MSSVEFDDTLFNDGLLHRNSPTASLAVTAELLLTKKSVITILAAMRPTVVQVGKFVEFLFSFLFLGYNIIIIEKSNTLLTLGTCARGVLQ